FSTSSNFNINVGSITGQYFESVQFDGTNYFVTISVDLQYLSPGINYTFNVTIYSLARVIVDYNKGDFFVDYTYVADEILVSYEYGDNVLDFRQNTNLPVGSNY